MKKRLKETIYTLFGDKIVDTLRKTEKEIQLKKEFYKVYKNRIGNNQYKNTHKGERCFILGNGPSLRKVKLSSLKDEFVFTVNNFSQVKNYENVKTNVHLWTDMAFFNFSDVQKYDKKLLIENYLDIARQEPICFVPNEAYGFMEEYKLEEKLNLHYLSILDLISEDNKLYFDISDYITGFNTVVQYAIVIAVYMGFKEIYLLGCDSTNILSVINCALNVSNYNMHAYDNDDVNRRYKELLGNLSMTEIFYGQYLLFLGYKRLYEAKLINCSDNTIINEIPRKKILDVL